MIDFCRLLHFTRNKKCKMEDKICASIFIDFQFNIISFTVILKAHYFPSVFFFFLKFQTSHSIKHTNKSSMTQKFIYRLLSYYIETLYIVQTFNDIKHLKIKCRWKIAQIEKYLNFRSYSIKVLFYNNCLPIEYVHM